MPDTPALRLFVAVTIPEEHRRAVDERLAPVRRQLSGARWVPVENQHVTCKFLGSTPADRLDAVNGVCRMVAAGRAPAELRLGGIGAFPSRKTVRVLWVGLHDPDGLLAGLAADLDQAFEPLGYAAEARRFTPHLTLARFRTPARLGSLPDLVVEDLEPFPIESLELYRSRLSPSGARYERMGRFQLATGSASWEEDER